MESIKIGKSKLIGEVKIPPSKSMAHRAIICASLSDGVSTITNIDYSDDIIATITGMEKFGAKIVKDVDKLTVYGIFRNEVQRDTERTVECNESGSTLRFLVPISLLFDGKTRFIGKGNLGKRPLETYFEIFRKQGIEYSNKENILDLIVEGNLKSDEFYLTGNVSSQFITGLLFTLPLLKEDSKVIITTPLESKGYIDLTIDCMKEFGVIIENKNYQEFVIKGNQRYEAKNYKVEGDYSQAAFYLCANALGNDIELADLNKNSLQGDKEIIDILSRMGVKCEFDKNLKCEKLGELKSTVIDASQCPDIIPVVSLVASLSKGRTEIINAKRLRIKECDRLHAVYTELTKLGAKIVEKEESLIIDGVKELTGGVEVWSYKDHRIAMTLAIAGTICKEPIVIKDYDCVAKSYPNFFEDYKMLGGNIIECNMGK